MPTGWLRGTCSDSGRRLGVVHRHNRHLSRRVAASLPATTPTSDAITSHKPTGFDIRHLYSHRWHVYSLYRVQRCWSFRHIGICCHVLTVQHCLQHVHACHAMTLQARFKPNQSVSLALHACAAANHHMCALSILVCRTLSCPCKEVRCAYIASIACTTISLDEEANPMV